VVVSVQPTVFTASLTNVTVGVPHASLAVTVLTSGAGTVALQPSVIVAGQLIDGGVTSTILVIVCVHTAVLPQASTARYVLVVVSVQPAVLTASFTKVTVGDPHASEAVTVLTSGAGTVALQPRVIVAGQLTDGGVTSTILVIVCVHTAELPQASTAR
jgi:hypothetical protein